MADDKLFPYQARVPVTADGALPSVDLLQFLNKLFKRVGEYTALTNIELEALTDTQSETLAYLSLAPAQPRQTRFDAAGFVWRYRSISTAATLAVGDFGDVDASGAAVAVTLPNVAASKGRIVGVSKVDSSANPVTISGAVNGQSSIMITRQYTSLLMLSNGSEWRLI